MVRTSLLACALGAVLAASPARAQQPSTTTLAPDQRVRIALPVEGGYRRVAGTVLEARGDTILLEVRGMQEKVALSSVHTLEISRGRRSRLRDGLTGGVLGTAVGAGLGIYLRENAHRTRVLRHRDLCTVPGDPSTCVRESYVATVQAPLFTTIGVSLAGTALGALAGAMLPGDRWQVVPRPGSSASPAGVSLAVRISPRALRGPRPIPSEVRTGDTEP